MSGRRGHQRLSIGTSSSGTVRVLRDVTVERMNDEELVVISQAPAATGEGMSLELFSRRGCVALTVRVVDSRPVVIDKSIRHRLRVAVETVGEWNTNSDGQSLADSPTTPDNA